MGMKQFYETYKGNEKLSPLVTQISWTNHLLIMSGSKSREEESIEGQIRECTVFAEKDGITILQHYYCNTRRVRRSLGVLTPMEKHSLYLAA